MVAQSAQQRPRISTGLLRYPGGKGKLLGRIIPHLQRMAAELGPDAEYREPFFGGGAVGLGFLAATPAVRRAWINDRDPAMSSLWDIVLHDPQGLSQLVEMFPEAVRLEGDGYFEFYKTQLAVIGCQTDLHEYAPGMVGLMKLAVHQISYSGLGTRAGGAMTKSLCRYNIERLRNRIWECHEVLSGVLIREGICTSLDFARLFEPGEALIYLDPPYYQAGPSLYQFAFDHWHHERLAELLRAESRPWLLSYDDHPVIVDLYRGWSFLREEEIGYSINGCSHKKELLITNVPPR